MKLQKNKLLKYCLKTTSNNYYMKVWSPIDVIDKVVDWGSQGKRVRTPVELLRSFSE